MADSKLSREHSLALLHKLATDDGFRGHYEQSPAAALAELGVPQETIAGLKASCTKPTTLAPKEHFADAHQELAHASSNACVGMFVPSIKMDFGPSP